MARKHWVPVHRWAGLVIALFIFITGLTGSIIAFRDELDALINPELFRVVERDASPLGPTELATKVESALPGAQVSFVYVAFEAGHSTRVLVQPGRDPVTGKRPVLDYDEVFVDPYDGKVLGKRKRRGIGPGRAHIMPIIYETHRTLLAGPIGKWFLGIIALVWMLDSFVGFYLTLPVAIKRGQSRAKGASPPPGKSFWQRWKHAWKIKWGAGLYRTQFDLHRAGGLWLWIVFFTLALTSVHLNLQWVKPVLQQAGPVTPSPFETLPRAADSHSPPGLDYDRALLVAATKLPDGIAGLEPLVIGYLRAQRSYYVYFRPTKSNNIPRVRFEQVFIDADTGSLQAGVGYDHGTTADKVLAWQFPLHTGQILGLPGRITISVAGLVAALLSFTGVYIWWKKRKPRTTHHKAALTR